MDTLRTLGLAVALGISTAALAQTQTPPDQAGTQTSPPASADQAPATGSPEPDAASSPHQREATSTTGTETQPSQSPDPSAASSPHQREAVGASPGSTAAEAPKLVGLQVVSASGEQLGSVTDVMADSATGAPTYIVIAPVPSSGGGASTAIPYGTATSMIRNETLVMDRAKLDGAPKVDQSKLKDSASTTWQSESDSYWGNTRAAAKDPTKPTG